MNCTTAEPTTASSLRLALAASLGLVLFTASPARAADEQQLINDAQATVERFRMEATQYPDLPKQLSRARAVLVFPHIYKAGFIIGGEGGRGVLLAHRGNDWSTPAFYSMASASIGLQAGAQAAETMLLVFSDDALNRLLSNKVKLGADIGVAVIGVGGGVEGSTTTNMGADIIAYSRAKGLYGGLTLEGAIVAPDEDSNQIYYGRKVSAPEIVNEGRVTNGAADGLRSSVRNAGRI
jgi:lipid-binding SYLF domain-containing protein